MISFPWVARILVKQLGKKEVGISPFNRIGVPVAHHKMEGPSTVLIFLRIQIDTASLQLSFPQKKVVRLRQLLEVWIWKRSCTRKDLESLLGHLLHAATVICPGCTFLQQLFSLLAVASRPSLFVCLNAVVGADLALWHCLIHHWNSLSFFLSAQQPLPVYSDASGSFG